MRCRNRIPMLHFTLADQVYELGRRNLPWKILFVRGGRSRQLEWTKRASWPRNEQVCSLPHLPRSETVCVLFAPTYEAVCDGRGIR